MAMRLMIGINFCHAAFRRSCDSLPFTAIRASTVGSSGRSVQSGMALIPHNRAVAPVLYVSLTPMYAGDGVVTRSIGCFIPCCMNTPWPYSEYEPGALPMTTKRRYTCWRVYLFFRKAHGHPDDRQRSQGLAMRSLPRPSVKPASDGTIWFSGPFFGILPGRVVETEKPRGPNAANFSRSSQDR